MPQSVDIAHIIAPVYFRTKGRNRNSSITLYYKFVGLTVPHSLPPTQRRPTAAIVF